MSRLARYERTPPSWAALTSSLSGSGTFFVLAKMESSPQVTSVAPHLRKSLGFTVCCPGGYHDTMSMSEWRMMSLGAWSAAAAGRTCWIAAAANTINPVKT